MNKTFLGIFLFVSSCSNNPRASILKFIEAYNNEDFSRLKNKSFTIRGYDNQGRLNIFIFDDANKCGFVRVFADKKMNITKQEPILQSENCTVDTPKSNYNLVKDFLAYKVGYLHVDSAENILFI